MGVKKYHEFAFTKKSNKIYIYQDIKVEIRGKQRIRKLINEGISLEGKRGI